MVKIADEFLANVHILELYSMINYTTGNLIIILQKYEYFFEVYGETGIVTISDYAISRDPHLTPVNSEKVGFCTNIKLELSIFCLRNQAKTRDLP